jgi:alpha-beta hydrolase superfamily lysophospholipase
MQRAKDKQMLTIATEEGQPFSKPTARFRHLTMSSLFSSSQSPSKQIQKSKTLLISPTPENYRTFSVWHERCSVPSSTIRFPSLKTRSMESFLGAFPRLADPTEIRKVRNDLPIYMFSGSDDPVGQRLEGVRALVNRYRSAGMTSVTHDFYPGGRHEMLHELNRHPDHSWNVRNAYPLHLTGGMDIRFSFVGGFRETEGGRDEGSKNS